MASDGSFPRQPATWASPAERSATPDSGQPIRRHVEPNAHAAPAAANDAAVAIQLL